MTMDSIIALVQCTGLSTKSVTISKKLSLMLTNTWLKLTKRKEMYYNTSMTKLFPKQFHFLLNEETRQKIREWAFKTEVSKADFIRIAIDRYIKHLEEK